ncbi:MAG: hypothetical protein Ta2D_00170 [Rickettsiales bacterium]|nr:MAG: hypothetical protein Ta2D_00170 [Rickettsiales bacterium]
MYKCYKIVAKTNEVFAFTTASHDIDFENVLYKSYSTMDISIVNDALKIMNFVDNVETDLLNADAELFVLKDGQKLHFITSYVESIEINNNVLIANIAPLKDKINKTIGKVYN